MLIGLLISGIGLITIGFSIFLKQYNVVIIGVLLIIAGIVISINNKEYFSLSQFIDSTPCLEDPKAKQPFWRFAKFAKLWESNPCLKSNTFSPEKLCSTCKEPVLIHESSGCFNRAVGQKGDFPFLPNIQLKNAKKEIHESGKFTNEELFKLVENGALIASAKDLTQLNLLLEMMEYSGGNGFPSFFGIDGPVAVLVKDGKDGKDKYFYMSEYPINWGKDIQRYANVTNDPEYAKHRFAMARRLTQPCYPLVVMSA